MLNNMDTCCDHSQNQTNGIFFFLIYRYIYMTWLSLVQFVMVLGIAVCTTIGALSIKLRCYWYVDRLLLIKGWSELLAE